jgi:hypothetical protein
MVESLEKVLPSSIVVSQIACQLAYAFLANLLRSSANSEPLTAALCTCVASKRLRMLRSRAGGVAPYLIEAAGAVLQQNLQRREERVFLL